MPLCCQAMLGRLRREAHDGPCPCCGRMRLRDMEKAVQSYAQGNSRLHAQLAKRGDLELTDEEALALWQRASGYSSDNDAGYNAIKKLEALLEAKGIGKRPSEA